METIQNVATKPASKAAEIRVLHCLNPQCDGLLAYEVDANNMLYTDLAWTATRDGDTTYFPCPKCGGKNIVEEVRTEKGLRHRVSRFLA